LLAEAYPDLKANQNFLELQNELVAVEDHLQYARRFYNGSVRILNTRRETVPDVIVARLFNFAPAEFFSADNRAAPEVKL
jgi:LemA protein